MKRGRSKGSIGDKEAVNSSTKAKPNKKYAHVSSRYTSQAGKKSTTLGDDEGSQEAAKKKQTTIKHTQPRCSQDHGASRISNAPDYPRTFPEKSIVSKPLSRRCGKPVLLTYYAPPSKYDKGKH